MYVLIYSFLSVSVNDMFHFVPGPILFKSPQRKLFITIMITPKSSPSHIYFSQYLTPQDDNTTHEERGVANWHTG